MLWLRGIPGRGIIINSLTKLSFPTAFFPDCGGKISPYVIARGKISNGPSTSPCAQATLRISHQRDGPIGQPMVTASCGVAPLCFSCYSETYYVQYQNLMSGWITWTMGTKGIGMTKVWCSGLEAQTSRMCLRGNECTCGLRKLKKGKKEETETDKLRREMKFSAWSHQLLSLRIVYTCDRNHPHFKVFKVRQT